MKVGDLVKFDPVDANQGKTIWLSKQLGPGLIVEDLPGQNAIKVFWLRTKETHTLSRFQVTLFDPNKK